MNCPVCDTIEKSPEAAAGFLIRLSLGVLFFTAGLSKFLAPEGAFGVARKIAGSFENTFLPGFMVIPYAYTLPFLEVLLGILLVLGLFTRPALLVSGLLLLSLAFGMMVQQQHDTVAYNLNYVFMAAIGLWFSAKANPWSLDRLLCGKCAGAE